MNVSFDAELKAQLIAGAAIGLLMLCIWFRLLDWLPVLPHWLSGIWLALQAVWFVTSWRRQQRSNRQRDADR